MAQNVLEKKCGCKGVRSCLICEDLQQKRKEEIETSAKVYDYCCCCGKAWRKLTSSSDHDPSVEHAHNCIDTNGEESFEFPGVEIVKDFLTDQEEVSLVSTIDGTPWVNSQSGRKKQDYGPKINFKKKKLNMSTFTGLPPFSKVLYERMVQLPLLNDFLPVELCNLEYNPARGSAIDPHVDDTWVWGERLVTVNLLDDTVYTMQPVQNKNLRTGEGVQNKNLTGQTVEKRNLMEEECLENKLPLDNHILEDQRDDEDVVNRGPDGSASMHDASKQVADDLLGKVKISQDTLVKIKIPRRSLLVIYGDARYQWTHAISRSDIVQRRIAVTLREFPPGFLDKTGNETNSSVGQDIVDVALTFRGQSVAEFQKQTT